MGPAELVENAALRAITTINAPMLRWIVDKTCREQRRGLHDVVWQLGCATVL
jgi:hypothetical protein